MFPEKPSNVAFAGLFIWQPFAYYNMRCKNRQSKNEVAGTPTKVPEVKRNYLLPIIEDIKTVEKLAGMMLEYNTRFEAAEQSLILIV
jgi:hypothetical protein